jgi:Holliday junction resolvase RusA-like endonuclease
MFNQQINIKPLSVNRAWKGRRFKTPDYQSFESELGYQLKKVKVPGHSIELILEFYLKNVKNSDADNFVKPIQDILVKNGVIEDDRFIYHLDVYKYPAEEDSVRITINNWKD